MKNRGYTAIELIGLIIILGLITLITLPKMSEALVDHSSEYYESDIALYLKRAQDYGVEHIENIKSSESYVVTIKDLVDAGFIGTSSGDITDPRDGTSMLGVKILLQYDEENNTVKASLAS